MGQANGQREVNKLAALFVKVVCIDVVTDLSRIDILQSSEKKTTQLQTVIIFAWTWDGLASDPRLANSTDQNFHVVEEESTFHDF
jgi:hypothetical protein